MQEETITSKLLYNGKIINLRIDEVRLPNGRSSTREIIEHQGAVVIIPLLDDGKIPVIKQFRKPVEEILYELPAGKLEKGEDPLTCAKRELLEETGFRADELIKVNYFFTTPGFSNEKMHLFLARKLKEEGQHLDQDEFLELESFTLDELIEMIRANKIKDAKTIIGLLWLKLYELGVFNVD